MLYEEETLLRCRIRTRSPIYHYVLRICRPGWLSWGSVTPRDSVHTYIVRISTLDLGCLYDLRGEGSQERSTIASSSLLHFCRSVKTLNTEHLSLSMLWCFLMQAIWASWLFSKTIPYLSQVGLCHIGTHRWSCISLWTSLFVQKYNIKKKREKNQTRAKWHYTSLLHW